MAAAREPGQLDETEDEEVFYVSVDVGPAGVEAARAAAMRGAHPHLPISISHGLFSCLPRARFSKWWLCGRRTAVCDNL